MSSSPPDPPSIVELIARGVLDAELAALVWLLVERRLPLIVAAPDGRAGAAAELVTAVVGSVRPDEPLDGLAAPMSVVAATNLVRGRRPAGIIEATSLAEIRERLGAGPMPLSPDQLTFLGCVLVLGAAGDRPRGRLRVVAAHYVRPLARDAHGHPQRLDPAVLATWDERLGRYEHFAWGVMPEIAARLGRRAGDLEADLHHRRDDLAGLARAGVTSTSEVRRLIAGYRVQYGGAHGSDGPDPAGHDPAEGGHDDHDHGAGRRPN